VFPIADMARAMQLPNGMGTSERRRRGVLWSGALIIGIGLLAVWAWSRGAEQRAIEKLPAEVRHALYSREMENFRTICGQGRRTDDLESRCEQQAQFIVKFSECDDDCQTLAKLHLISPAR
jgi:cytochrome b pre-mRNA-processing protein 3